MRYYLVGVLINLTFLCVLRFTTDTRVETTYWRNTDANEYVAYAKGFLDTGTFYDQTPNEYIAQTDGKPGYRRTIGYPMLIASFMWLYGDGWLVALQIFNCLFFALLYLIIPAIIREMFGVRKDKQVFWILLITGIVFARVPQALNNTFFAVMFFGSIWLGIRAIKTDRWWMYLLYIIAISFTATVRLNLAWYFLFNILLFVYFRTDIKKITA
jgi:hypothetical protein